MASTERDRFDERPPADEGAAKRARPSGAQDVGERMLEAMGGALGKGLGKYGQGPSTAPAATSNYGTVGLGFHVPGLSDASLAGPLRPDEHAPLPRPQWLAAPAAPPPDVARLEGWAYEAPRRDSMEGETHFVDPAKLSGMLQSKSALDLINTQSPEFTSARQRANPYEGIDKEFFQNRAALKMAAIDAACDYALTLPGAGAANARAIVARRLRDEAAVVAEQQGAAPDPAGRPPPPATRGGADSGVPVLYFGDLAAGPGGFSEYVLWRRGPSAKGIGFTLRGEGKDDFKLDRFHYRALPEALHPYYGPDGRGDLRSSASLRALRDLVHRQTEGAGLHLVMADGGFDVRGKENMQEVENKRLLLGQCIAALATLRRGGAFVCKCFDLFTPFSASLLYLLHCHFDYFCIYKPPQSRPANSERYLLCRGYRRGAQTEALVEHLLPVGDRLEVLAPGWNRKQKGRDVASLVPVVAFAGTPFATYLRQSNNQLAVAQTRALQRLVKFFHDRFASIANQSATRDECLALWGIPSQVAKPHARPGANTFLAAEIERGDLLPDRQAVVTPLRLADLRLADGACKLRLFRDWVVVEAATAAPPSFLMGADDYTSDQVRRGIALHWRCGDDAQPWECVRGLKLPRATLLLAEVVGDTAHAIDAAVLAGDDVRRLSYAERRRRLAHLVDVLDRDDEIVRAEAGEAAAGHVRLRLKPDWPLRELASALKAEHGILLFPGHGGTGEAPRRPLSFRNCLTNYVRWERAAPGEVSEAQLLQLAADCRARG